MGYSRMWLKQWGGHFLAASLGLIIIGVAELGLRQVDDLRTPPFTVELARAGERVLQSVNPQYARRFFSGVDAPGMRMTPQPYIDPLPAGALRVVVAGGSTIQGYPHPRRLTAAAYLKAMLEDVWPERPVEVFNIGITAVSSFAVARAVEDAMSLNPDVVVVYTGHNEVYGVYGSGSLSQGGASIMAKNVHYAAMQWSLSALVRHVLDLVRPPADNAPVSLLRVMSAAGSIGVDDLRRQQAGDNLSKNLLNIAEICREYGAQLILCTLASNERGFAASYSEPMLEEKELLHWRAQFEQGKQLLGAGRAQEALSLFDSAALLDADNAILQFNRARSMEKLGEVEAAYAAYSRARDLDLNPWRATSALNEVIRDIASEERIPLADIDQVFRDHSPAAGIGWELMADHLHPSSRGQILMAREITSTLMESSTVLAPGLGEVKSDEAYLIRQGDNPLERLALLHDMQALLSEEPMKQGNEDHVRQLGIRADSLWKTLVAGERNGYQRWRQGKGAALLALNAADQLFAARDFARAEAYYWAARQEEPYTPWGDLWATLRWGRCRMLTAELGDVEKEQIAAMVERMQLVSQAPDFTPGLNAFFGGYAEYLLGGGGVEQLEFAAEDAMVRRLFFYDLLTMLCEGLLQQRRYDDADRYIRQITQELGQGEFGQFLLKRVAVHRSGEN